MTTKIKDIPAGYKDSPAGIIPSDWEVKRLEKLYKSLSSFSFSRDLMTDIKQCIHYIHYGDIHKNVERDTANFEIDQIPYLLDGSISKDKFEIENFPFLKDGDVILTDASEDYEGIGKPLEVINISNKKAISGLHTILLRPLTNTISIGYGRYIFRNFEASKSLKRIAQGTKVYSISYNNIKGIQIALPPLAEQKKIAEVLSAWDEAVEKQSLLVAALQKRKKALMQQLLTGRKRLKGFSGEWKEMKIREFAKEVSLKNKKNKELTVLSCTKYDGLVPSLEYFGRRIFAEDTSSYKIVPKDHFAYATNHIEEGSIGYQKAYTEALISPMYTVFKTESSIVNDDFLFSLLKSHKLIYNYNARMEGSIDRRGGLRWDAFSGIKVHIPTLIEQTAIAKVFSATDKEIELAQQKLDSLRQQKKGLMQQLLTGKTRVKTEFT